MRLHLSLYWNKLSMLLLCSFSLPTSKQSIRLWISLTDVNTNSPPLHRSTSTLVPMAMLPPLTVYSSLLVLHATRLLPVASTEKYGIRNSHYLFMSNVLLGGLFPT